MPELPDITLYADAMRSRVIGRRVQRLSIRGAFLLRTVDPPPESCQGRECIGVLRLGKRLILELEHEQFLAIHLMIAGRLLWKPPGTRPRSKIDLAAIDFGEGVLLLTEASAKKRAAMHVLRGRSSLETLNARGLDVLTCSEGEFRARLQSENRTLKRALTTPRLFDAIGNAYSDEILHAARLSPISLTRSLSDDGVARLASACRRTLVRWTDRLRAQFGLDAPGGGRFPGPGDITAFRPDFAVHGRYGLPCPVCASPVQRIVHAENETNYCPGCQTDGRVLADRSLSRLLKDDWPRTIEEWEEELGG